ncbi:regulator [Vibrio campbellii]|uniref:regulator n=1 Tax=Vibrio campbellii TaxID=680 RepID=UPI000B2F6882
MKYHEITKNYIFRKFECGLSKEQTAKPCFKSVKKITKWDKEKTIPPECKWLMRPCCLKEISISSDWDGFKIAGNKLVLPTGHSVTPQQTL